MTVNCPKEVEDLHHKLICPRSKPIREIKDPIPSTGLWQRRAVPKHLATIGGENACYGFQERRFACSIWTDEAKHFSCSQVERNLGQCSLLSIAFAQPCNLHGYNQRVCKRRGLDGG